jgi:glycosyltransferase involved in cell wall biosynthesis
MRALAALSAGAILDTPRNGFLYSDSFGGPHSFAPADLNKRMTPEQPKHAALLSVVVPAYNEAATLAAVVEKLLAVPQLLEIVVVDDCSTDRTREVAEGLAAAHAQVRVERHERNRGKTEALRTGFRLTRGEIVIVQDADLEYDPAEIPLVILPIVNRRADVVYGSRFLVRRATRVLYFYHYLGNKFLTFLSNLLTNLNMTDIETGYKAFRGDIIRNMRITSSGFGFEVEVTAKVAKLGCAVYEVPISYYGRTYDEGKKIGLRDGLQALWLIFRFNLFCSLDSSFTRVPTLKQVERHNFPAATAEGQTYG